MKLRAVVAIALLAVGLDASFEDCPRHCSCTQSSFAGGQARCTLLDPAVQRFPNDIAHLSVENYPDERLPANIFTELGLSGLLSVRLTNGSLMHINRDAFLGLNYLEDIDLSFNKIHNLDPHSFETTHIKRLNLDGNPLMTFDPQLPKESHVFLFSDSLVELTLSQTKISTTEDVQALSKLTNLEFLDLSHNELKELKDDMFSALTNLEEIDLSHNKISHIDRDTFADIEELTLLNLRGNPLRTLEGIEIPGLKDLDVSNCKFEMLAASTLEGFPELASLNFSQNSIMSIDMDTFMSVPGLKDLDLSYNRLRGPLNPLLFEFNKRLETLSFQGNTEIKYLPGFTGDFSNLYNFDISKCGLTGITNDTFKNMNYLVNVNASGNSLVHIDPKTFANLPNLVVLDLSNNLLHALHSRLFANNKDLSKLYLSGNFFKHLPPVLFQSATKLHLLDVSNCRLTSLWNISESFMMRNRNILSKLIYLNVSGNKLTKLHTHYFISLQNLQKLDISDNPIECTPDFSHVMQWLIMKKVVPNKVTTERPLFERLDLIENNVQWDEVLRVVCPTEVTTKIDTYVVHPIPVQEFQPDKAGIEIPIIEETPLVWPMVLVWASIFSLLFALANIIGLLIYRSRRNYKVLGYRPQFSSTLDGHFQVRRGGRPIYQKLYEECSIPAPIHDGKKVRIVAILGNALGGKTNVDV